MRSSVPADASPAAAVVRVACGPDWARRLPRVPPGGTVTVSLGRPGGGDDRAALQTRGYRVVGVFPSMLAGADAAVADLLVPEDLIEGHPTWWRELTALAVRVYSLHHGPVRRAFGLS